MASSNPVYQTMSEDVFLSETAETSSLEMAAELSGSHEDYY